MRSSSLLHSASALACGFLIAVCSSTPASARCVKNGTTTTCDTAPPNPETSAVQNTVVVLLPNAAVSPTAFVNPASVTIDPSGSLTTGAGSLITDMPPQGGNAVFLGDGATASLSGVIRAPTAGSRAVVMENLTSLTLNQGGLIEVSGAPTQGFRPSKAAISTGQGSQVTISIQGTVRSTGNDAPAIAGFNTGAPALATRFGPVTLTVGPTGIVETTGLRSPALHLGGTSSATISGIVRSSGIDSPAILSLGTTINVLQGGSVISSAAPAISGSTPSLTIAGTVTGPSANTVAVDLGAGDDLVILTTTGRINGILSGGGGSDRLVLSAGQGASGNYDFQAQPIVGFEQMVSEGPGTFTLTGDARSAGIATFGVSGGTLVQNANFNNAQFAIAQGARLTGTGDLGAATVNGSVAPDTNGFGTINVAGSIAFNSGSIFEVQANAAGASDRIVAAGPATIAGGTVQVLAENGTYAPSTQYVILGASGVSGAFSGVTSNLAFLTPSLAYLGNEVRLLLVRNDLQFSDAASNPNQLSTGQAVERLGAANPIYIALVGQSVAGARAAFDALSGEVYPTVASFLTLESRTARNGLLQALATAPDGVATWGEANRTWGRTDVNASLGTARGRSDVTGVMGGVTWRRNGLAAILGVGGFDQDYRIAARSSRASIDTLFFGGAINYVAGPFSVAGGYGYGSHDLTALRTVDFAGLGETGATMDGHTSQLFGDAAFTVSRGWIETALFVDYAHVSTRLGPATEVVSPAGLSVDIGDMDTGFLSGGLRLRGGHPASQRLTFVPRASLAYVRTTGDRRGMSAMRFPGATTSFAIAGTPLPRDAADIRLGFELVGRKVRIGVSYDGLIGSGWSSYAARLTGSFTF